MLVLNIFPPLTALSPHGISTKSTFKHIVKRTRCYFQSKCGFSPFCLLKKSKINSYFEAMDEHVFSPEKHKSYVLKGRGGGKKEDLTGTPLYSSKNGFIMNMI